MSSPVKKLSSRSNGKKGGRPVLNRYIISSKAGAVYGVWYGRTEAHALARMLQESYSEIQWDKERDCIVYPDDEIERLCGNIDNWNITEVEKPSRRRNAGGHRPILHKDGTVTYWSVYNQQWERKVEALPDNELAAMGEDQRERVMKHLIGD